MWSEKAIAYLDLVFLFILAHFNDGGFQQVLGIMDSLFVLPIAETSDTLVKGFQNRRARRIQLEVGTSAKIIGSRMPRR